MESIFSTAQRVRILQSIILRKEPISVNQIASRLKLSKGLLSKYFDILKREGILKKVNGKFTVADSPLTKGIKILLSISGIDTKAIRKYPFVKGVGLYGSCSKGENTEDSDVDLWIRIESTSDENLASLTSSLNKRIRNVKVLFLTDEKITRIRDEDRLFYQSLVFGSIIVYGGKDGI